VLKALPFALLALVVASCGGGGGQPGVPTDRSPAAPVATDSPGDPVTLPAIDKEAKRDEALGHNLIVTQEVRAALDGRMKDLPERLHDFGMRHGGVSVYETLPSGGIENTPGNITSLVKGTSKNILVSLPTEEFYLRYAIAPDGARHVVNIRVRTSSPSGDDRYRLEFAIYQIEDPSRHYFVGAYFDRDTFATQGAQGSSELNGNYCTVNPAHVEMILAKLDADLQR